MRVHARGPHHYFEGVVGPVTLFLPNVARYLERQEKEVQRVSANGHLRIPRDFDYTAIPCLSSEEVRSPFISLYWACATRDRCALDSTHNTQHI